MARVAKWVRRCICVRQVSPVSSLLEGGTMVTIEGTNLGHRVEQVRDAVTVAGQPCTIQSRLYVVSVKSVHCIYISISVAA